MGLREAIKSEAQWKETENGAVALNTSGHACVDFFGLAGSMRERTAIDKCTLFDAAYAEDGDIAMKVLFYTRDPRGGYGEKLTFQQIFTHLANVHTESVVKNLWAVLEFGRAKDLYYLVGTPAEDEMWKFMKEQFELDYENMKAGKSISLLAKWIATPDSKSEKTKELGKLTAKKLGYTFKTMSDYKRKLREMRKYLDLPEAKMCAGHWDEIEYSKCASRFMLKNRKAFMKHDAERYQEFVGKVNKGEAKMNMNTVNPCEILKDLIYGGSDDASSDAQWKSLPDYVDGNVLVMADTSSSMTWHATNGLYPITVALSLAMYTAERNKGDLKNLFMTFDSNPQFVELKGATLRQRYKLAQQADWGGSTNLEAAFDLLLKTCVRGHVAQDEMPKAIIIVSDMEINCVRGVDRQNRMTFYDAMAQRYEQAGYKMPQVVFWNVNGRNNTFHVSSTTAGVALCSGWSVNVLKDLMNSIGVTPYEMMMNAIGNEKYADIIA